MIVSKSSLGWSK